MDSKKPNKITQIVRLQQVLKKWKNVANNASKNNPASDSATTSSGSSGSSNKGINKFLKRTLSFTDFSSSRGESSSSSSSTDTVPKGFLAVCVGEELKRFIIPTEYLGHQVFEMLLRQAEEEFGFQQEGVLKIPCQVSVFEKILKVVQDKSSDDLLSALQEFGFSRSEEETKTRLVATHHQLPLITLKCVDDHHIY